MIVPWQAGERYILIDKNESNLERWVYFVVVNIERFWKTTKLRFIEATQLQLLFLHTAWSSIQFIIASMLKYYKLKDVIGVN